MLQNTQIELVSKMGEENKRITSDIIKESLAKKFQVHINNVEVKSFDIDSGAEKGENFNGVLKSVKATGLIKGEEKKAEFMVKVMPMNEHQIQWLTAVSFFEMFFLHKTLNTVFNFINSFLMNCPGPVLPHRSGLLLQVQAGP